MSQMLPTVERTGKLVKLTRRSNRRPMVQLRIILQYIQ